ncbi:SigE family RNA polymerase sigma factor [Luteipulveratus sp. YIM 133132]|uniref:SigE family RNA polymerase sigma factor n=1 Tax=Luteipulveratus flavus TaxID=3031728 RepID=UPI0023AFB6F1|nr:SigE family RNA polymerase sigma factor [Luteipulveratus sp. YIM 133132]MDE9365440.1 SigE family RNA polymerase sigma factor [Luteipulveratus sp. YIM 133132]
MPKLVHSSDRTDFEEFVEHASPSLLHTAWLLTGQVDASRELVQAALVKTYVAWSRVRPGEALAFARRVLVNHHTDTWRRRRRETVLEDMPEAPGPDRALETVEERREIVRLLALLPKQQRTVVVLRYYADFSEAAVADLLGISTGSVKSAASRGLARLRAELGEPASVTDLNDRRRQA